LQKPETAMLLQAKWMIGMNINMNRAFDMIQVEEKKTEV
jgi:hypothetical protein